MILHLRCFYLLLMVSVVLRNVNGRIPQELEKDQMCVGRKFPGESFTRTLSFYDRVNTVDHTYICGYPGSLLADDHTGVISKKCTPPDICPYFTGAMDAGVTFLNPGDVEFGLNDGKIPSDMRRLAVFWSHDVPGYKHGCDSNSVWNLFYVYNFDDRKQRCYTNVFNNKVQEYNFAWSRNHDRGFPVVLFHNSMITKSADIEFVWKNGCDSSEMKKTGNTCIRLVNSIITGHADKIQPDDVIAAFESIKKELLKSKIGGEDERLEHPRQMLYYVMLGVSLFCLLAVIASIFAIPKDHDFPVMYQKGVATVGKKGKKGKKAGKTGKTSTGLGGKTSTGLSGIGKTGKTTTGMSGMGKTSKMAGKTSGSTMTGGGGKKGKKDKGPAKKDKNKNKKKGKK